MLRRAALIACAVSLFLTAAAPGVFAFRAVFLHFGGYTVSILSTGPTFVSHLAFPMSGVELGRHTPNAMSEYLLPTAQLAGSVPRVSRGPSWRTRRTPRRG